MSLRSLLVRSVLALLVLLVLGAAAVVWVVATPGGTQRAVALASGLSDGRLSVRATSGTLHRALALEDVRYDDGATVVEAGALTLSWTPEALLRGTLSIGQLTLDRVTLALPPAAEEAPAAETDAQLPAFPELPLAVRVERFELSEATLVSGDARHTLELLRLALRADARALELEVLEAQLPGHAVDGRVAVRNAEPLALEGALEWRGELGAQPGSGTLALGGDLAALELTVAGRAGAYGGRLEGSFELTRPVPRYAIRVAADPVALDESGETRLEGLTLDASGDLDHGRIEVSAGLRQAATPPRGMRVGLDLRRDAAAWLGAFDWRAELGPDIAPVAGDGRLRVEGEEVSLALAAAPPYPVTVDGSATLGEDPVVALAAAWDSMQLALAVGPLELDAGTLTLEGPLSRLAVAARAGATAPTVGPVALDLEAEVSPVRLRLKRANVDVLDGRVALDGEVALGAAPTGMLAFSGSALNLAALRADLETRLDLGGRIGLSATDEGPAVRVDLERASGDWRGSPLAASAVLEHAPGAIELSDARLTLGQNRADVAATLTETLNASFDVDFAELGLFADGLGGSLTLSGSAAGDPSRPAVDLVLDAPVLRFGDVAARSVAGRASFDLAADVDLDVALAVEALRLGEAPPARLALEADGRTAAHRLTLSWSRPDLDVALSASGALAQDDWSGDVETLALDHEELGAWALDAPMAVAWRSRRANVGQGCLRRDAAALCVAVRDWAVDGAGGEAELDLTAFPLEALQDYLPTTLRLNGQTDVAAMAVNADGGPTVRGTIGVREANVVLTTAQGVGETIPLERFAAQFALDPALVTVAASAAVGDWFVLEAELEHGLDAARSIDGTVELAAGDLGWIGEFVPAMAGSTGAAELRAALGGSLDAPRATVDGRLVSGRLLIPATGTRVSSLTLRVDTQASGELDFALDLAEGDGTLSLTGAVAPDAARGWPGSVRLSGEDFPVVRLPEAEADVSPALTASFSAEETLLGGRLVIPRVKVNLIELPDSAVAPSDDEIIVGPASADDAAEPVPGYFAERVAGDVELALGDDVGIDAAGLEARLAGGLRWTKSRGESFGRGVGRISIAEGAYRAYGQNLNVERGHLVFGGPIDNPSLDVRAVRADIPVTAGIRVTGYLTAPSFALFSDPALADSEILSYIITGRGLSDASSDQAGLIASAALSLGAERGAVVTSQVQDAFGLDEFTVATGDTATDTSFVAGKRLTPKLSVRSDFNPFDRLWSFFVNYKLTNSWSVEAESGQRQGADLIYSFDRDTLLPEGWFD
ncbi:MAG: translocation/assembly module TamB domain-containing protein [Gammaproteobacteria bacterium]